MTIETAKRARGSRPDAVRGNEWYLIKLTSHLRLTYQIRLLAFMAHSKGARLTVLLPQQSTVGDDLATFVREHAALVQIRRR